LKRFNVRKFQRESGELTCEVEILLTDQVHEDLKGLKFVFTEVVELKVGDLNGYWGTLLDISDIFSWGLERIRYRVVDSESECFSLNCHDFEVSAVS